MATNKILALTTSEGNTISLETTSVLFFIDNADNKAVVYYTDNTPTLKNLTLTIDAATLQALATQAFVELTLTTGETVYVNNSRVTKVLPSGVKSQILFYTGTTAETQPFNIDDTAANVHTALGTTISVTDDASGVVYYINGSLVVDIQPKSVSTTVLESATVASRGTAMVAGTTELTLSGGTFITVAKVLVTNTEVATATKTASGTLYSVSDVLTLDTGTGTAATITVDTVDVGGEILTFTLTTRGNYTVNPTLTNCTVTGGTGSGATFTLVMGAKTVSVSQAGSYTVIPSSPILTTGGGNNATLTGVFGEGFSTGSIIAFDGKSDTTNEQLIVENTKASLTATINAL